MTFGVDFKCSTSVGLPYLTYAAATLCVVGAAVSSTPRPSLPRLSVLWELHGAIDFKKNLCQFSVGNLKVITYGKLLRFI